MCFSVFTNEELRFPFTRNWIKISKSCVLLHTFPAWRICVYKKLVCTVKHMLSLMFLSVLLHNSLWSIHKMCTVCEVSCTVMVNDLYYGSVVWCGTKPFQFFTHNLLALHVWVGSIRVQHQRIVFFASIKCLRIHSLYSEVGVMTADILVILFCRLF
jgi:hypothetical protein